MSGKKKGGTTGTASPLEEALFNDMDKKAQGGCVVC